MKPWCHYCGQGPNPELPCHACLPYAPDGGTYANPEQVHDFELTPAAMVDYEALQKKIREYMQVHKSPPLPREQVSSAEYMRVFYGMRQ